MYQGISSKLKIKYDEIANYSLKLSDDIINLNELLGHKIKLSLTNLVQCTGCGQKIKKTYNQGYCYMCTKSLAACDICIVKPELCHFHKGTCREPDWGENNCMQNHVVYLANSSGIKVGITKERNIPMRFLDQGAVNALLIFAVKTRLQSGLIEKACKEYLNDKTNWRKMLQKDIEYVNLPEARNQIFSRVSETIQSIAGDFPLGDIEFLTNEKPLEFVYPINSVPEKINSVNLIKNTEYTDVLTGMKGQYLIFEKSVLNMRNLIGYELILEC